MDRQKVIEMLLTGRDSAMELQALLRTKGGDTKALDLAVKVRGSLTAALSMINPGEVYSDSHAETGVGSDDSGECKQRNGRRGTGRRGCYKRRKAITNVVVSQKMEDGHGWRKYGQKKIQNSGHPRCYYRCTYKGDGCKATKQVQRLEGETPSFQLTYFEHHTCGDRMGGESLLGNPPTFPHNGCIFNFGSKPEIPNRSAPAWAGAGNQSKAEDWDTPSFHWPDPDVVAWSTSEEQISSEMWSCCDQFLRSP